MASKLFDATELYSSTDILNTNKEIHNFHHLHRSTSHRLNDELLVNFNNDKREQIHNLTHSRRFRRSKSNFQSNEQINWFNDHFKLKELPGLRYIRADGALVFPPFSSSFYSPSVHHTGYVCVAWNAAGTIISAQVNVKAGKYPFFCRIFFFKNRRYTYRSIQLKLNKI